MTTTSAEEVPFTAGMEHETEPVEAQKPVAREYTFSIARSLFRMHGMAHRVLETLGLAQSRALSLAEGPLRDPESEYERGRRDGTRHITYANGDTREPREPNGEKRLLTWILGIVGILLVGGVGSVIGMYGKLSSIEKGQEGHENRINRLEADRDQRYRGASAASP